MNTDDETTTTAFEEHANTGSIKGWFGKMLPRPEIVFACQMVVIYIIIGVSLFNLTIGTGDAAEGKLWVAFLSSCLGYILPNPKLENRLTTPGIADNSPDHL